MLALTALLRPGIARRQDTRLLDGALLVAIAVVLLQVTPLPTSIRWLLSPNIDVDRFSLLLIPDTATSWRSLSMDPLATAFAAALVAACVCVFWSCRHLSGRGHALALAQVVAAVGLAGALAAIVQRAVEPTRIYGIWLAQDPGARPFGPFVNRNHFATWLLMAIPLTAGAVAAMRGGAQRPGVAAAIAAGVRALGTRRGWLAVSVAVMLLALILSFSRSAFVAGVVVVGCWCVLGAGRTTKRGLLAALVAAALLGLVVAWAAPPQPILARLRETLALGTAGRAAIWSDARDVARTYPVTGTGLATFERSMLIYQTTDRETRTNQAHSQYLQMLAEGGVLLAIPAILVCLTFAWVARRRLREDHSPAVWLRIGSLAALAGVAVQGVWETGLRMPANGVLLAVVAAIAVHRPMRLSEPPERGLQRDGGP